MTPGQEPIHVTLLVQQGCHFCHDAEDILGRLEREYPIVVAKLDLTTEEGERTALRHGLLFPPGIVIEDQAVSSGRPSEGRIRKFLDAWVGPEASFKAAATGRA